MNAGYILVGIILLLVIALVFVISQIVKIQKDAIYEEKASALIHETKEKVQRINECVNLMQ